MRDRMFVQVSVPRTVMRFTPLASLCRCRRRYAYPQRCSRCRPGVAQRRTGHGGL